MIFLFWLFLGLIIYCYFGYPLLLSLCAKVRKKAVRKSSIEPTVSVILSVFNEEHHIERKIQNLLSLEYPREKINFFIGSDGSTDQTCAVIRKFADLDPRVCLVEFKERRGKMAVLNSLAQKVSHEVIVFTDARQDFERDAIQQLVNNFHDPLIGCVSGELLLSRKEGATAEGLNLYWNYEKMIRRRESDLHSMLGATGAIYAIRRELFRPLPENIVLDDMYIPLSIVSMGYRAVFDDSAKAYDEVAESPKQEYRRKARTLYGNYQIFGMFKKLFVPGFSPVSIQFFSHKVLRVIAPMILIGLFFVNLLLIGKPSYTIGVFLQMIFYSMAGIGALVRYEKYGMLKVIARICYIPYVFCLLNFSALAGFMRFISAKQSVMWDK
ncbi:MAG: glycosyltransferase family 2 protein [Candidatus Omnitrophica bacterium]|nr:glycosyltransferase family 2 protein [Candidatus Omnitrophota bacterium]